LWKANKKLVYQPQNNNNAASPLAALISAAINAAATRAAPNYMPLAKQANSQVFSLPPDAIPDGPYKITK
jgi:hypothetical protein